MLNHYPYSQDTKSAKVIKMFTWLAFDVFLTGLIAYNWIVLQVHAFAAAVDTAEKFILFICTATFASYRIYILHIDAQKKKIELDEMKNELREKKAKRV